MPRASRSRWPGWQDEAAALHPDQGIAVYPFLCTAESRPVARAARRPVPFTELLAQHADLERQAGQLPPAAGSPSTPAGGPDT